MSNEVIEAFMIVNEQTVETAQIDKISVEGTTIYEVIRVIDGVPLFVEYHFERLLASARTVGFEIQALLDKIKQDLKRLIVINDHPNKNIKIMIYKKNNTCNYVLYFIKSVYPSDVQYCEGVPVIIYKAQRDNPNAKVINNSLREKINLALRDTNTYEAILVNDNNMITEGSRSNLFLAVGNSIYTAPENEILIGITRVFVADICRSLGIELIEQSISIDLLHMADGLFLTGTSPKVLPISKVDNLSFNSSGNLLIKKIMNCYDAIIKEYIQKHKEIENV